MSMDDRRQYASSLQRRTDRYAANDNGGRQPGSTAAIPQQNWTSEGTITAGLGPSTVSPLSGTASAMPDTTDPTLRESLHTNVSQQPPSSKGQQVAQPVQPVWPVPQSIALSAVTHIEPVSNTGHAALHPSQTGTLSTSDELCEECETSPAESNCGECEMNYCQVCWAEIHSCGTLVNHKPQALVKRSTTVTCKRCQVAEAVVQCEECDLVLCANCDQSLHQKGARKRHQRKRLQDNAAPASAPTVPLCGRCNKLPALLACSDCSVVCCVQCDNAIHAKGKRATHHRNPLPVVLPAPVNFQPQPPATGISAMSPSQTKASSSVPISQHAMHATEETNLGRPSAMSSNRPPLQHHSTAPSLDSLGLPHQGQAQAQPNAATRQQQKHFSSSSSVAPSSPLGPQQQPDTMPFTQLTSADVSQPALHQQQVNVHTAPGPSPVSAPSHSTSAVTALMSSSTSAWDVIPVLSVHCDHQDADTLTQKVLVAEDGIRQLVVPYLDDSQTSSVTRAGDCSWLDFTQLSQSKIKTVGLYGNKHGIGRWLVERCRLKQKAVGTLLESPPGVRCISNGGNTQFLYYQPTADAFIELSRKNLSCNMMRYVLELCDEVLIFYGEDEMDMFYDKPFTNQRADKRTQKMVMSFKKDSEEDIQFLPGFTADLSDIKTDSGSGVHLAHSCHVRSLHVGELVPKRIEFQAQVNERFSPQKLQEFLDEKMKNFKISFARHIAEDDIIQLLKLGSPTFLQMATKLEEDMEELDRQLKQTEKELGDKESEDRQSHGATLEKAVTALIARKCEIAKYFFPEFHQQVAAVPTAELITCPICMELLDEPAQLVCQHAFCKGCLIAHAQQSGKLEKNGVLVECPLCRSKHSLELEKLPEPNLTLKQLLDHAKSDSTAKALREVKQRQKREFEEATEYVNKQLRRFSEDAWYHRWSTRAENIDQLLNKEMERLMTMGRAYVVYSLALDEGWLKNPPTADEDRLRKLSRFVCTGGGYNGKGVVDDFVKDRSSRWSLTGMFSGESKPSAEEVAAKEGRLRQDVVKQPLMAGKPGAFLDTGCQKMASEIKRSMVRLIKQRLEFRPATADKKTQEREDTRVKKLSLKSETLRGMLQTMNDALTPSSSPLKLEVQSIHLYDRQEAKFAYQRQHQRGTEVCQVGFREEHVSSITHVEQLYTFDLLKADLDRLQEDSTAVVNSQPRITRGASSFPVSPGQQQLLRMYSLKVGKLLVFMKDKNSRGVNIYVQKPVDYRRQTTLPRPTFQLKREHIDLVDFDEDTRMAAFHSPGKQTVDIYRFDSDWKQWSLRCHVELQPHKGKAILTHMLFMPGQEKLCFIDDRPRCHIFDVQERVMRKRTIDIGVSVDHSLVSLDGSSLLIFTVEEHPVPDIGQDEAQSSSGDELDGPFLSGDDSTSGVNAACSDDEEAPTAPPCPSEDKPDKSLVDGDIAGSHGPPPTDPTAPSQVCENTVRHQEATLDGEEEEKEDTGGITLVAKSSEKPDTKSVSFPETRQSNQTARSSQHPLSKRRPVLQCKRVIAVYVYSLVNFKFIKKTDLDEDYFPPECLQSLRLVMLGPQMHMVAVNERFNSLISRMIDIRSARNVFHMMDFDRCTAKSAPASVAAKSRPANYLDYLYHVYDKFCVEDCLRTSRCTLNLTCVLAHSNLVIQQQLGGGQLCHQYVKTLFDSLAESTHKPMHRFAWCVAVKSLAESCQPSAWPEQPAGSNNVAEWLQRLISLVPIQLCRAEQNQLTLFSNGLKKEATLSVPTVFQLQETIQFGLYEAILDWWTGPVKVISSMGKQSTGKSYMLNHLTGSLFDISGDRCTDGVWLTVRLAKDCLYVVLDFEGLGSLERSEQEDMFLSVMNAAISGLTLFKTEFRVDQDTRNMLSRFRDGVDLIKGDTRLLRGWFYINIKDVDKRDIKDLQAHFRTKLQDICKEDENNFLTKMYRGQLTIQTFPTLGNAEFYLEMDEIRLHLDDAQTPSFTSGREFKDVLKLLMSKIHMQEWSSFDRTMVALKVDRLHRGLTFALGLGHLINHNQEEEPLLLSNGDPVPDSGLQLNNDQSLADFVDSGIVLSRDKPDRELVQPLFEKFSEVFGSRDAAGTDVDTWCQEFQEMLNKISNRRCHRVTHWVTSHVGNFTDDGDVQILQREVKGLLTQLTQAWSPCQTKCAKCFYPCLLLKYHDGDHDCIGDHKCHQWCEFCTEADVDDDAQLSVESEASGKADVPGGESEDMSGDEVNKESLPTREEAKQDVARVLQCGDQAGHGGKHDCKERNHTCNEVCLLFEKDNCNHYCSKKIGHERDPADAEHRCNAIQHLCGKKCALPDCHNKCISPHELTHERCACRDTACPQKCCIPTCNNKCSEVHNHFHDIPAEDGVEVKHFCGMEHACTEDCENEGICEIVSERIIEKKQFRTSVGDEFEYQSVTEQNGTRKKCCIPIPANQEMHEGSHCCTTDENRYHFCDRRCPACNYFCTLEFNHDETLHSTDHGNMRLTYVVSEKESFTVDTRRYGVGDRGEAEMCNFHCKSLGRGHIHIMVCEDGAASSATCTVSKADGKQHETCKYGPNEDVPKDELTHEAFWRTIRFRDPCAPEDQETFKLCPFECNADEHEKDGSKFFCTGPLWHDPYTHSDLAGRGGVGHIHSSGHHFECMHSGTGPIHHVLLVDHSGSMGDTDCTPSLYTLKATHNNRLGAVIDACNQYLTMRAAKAQNDVVSFIPFESSARVLFRGEPLNPAVLLQKMMTIRVSGGTDFSPVSELFFHICPSLFNSHKKRGWC